jgi:hypothetical protein
MCRSLLICGCRKLMQPTVPTVTLEVWTQGLAANWSASGFWDNVFSSGSLDAVGPLKLKLIGRFLNATTQLVSHMAKCRFLVILARSGPAQQEATAVEV